MQLFRPIFWSILMVTPIFLQAQNSQTEPQRSRGQEVKFLNGGAKLLHLLVATGQGACAAKVAQPIIYINPGASVNVGGQEVCYTASLSANVAQFPLYCGL